jgi:hypothetical protein
VSWLADGLQLHKKVSAPLTSFLYFAPCHNEWLPRPSCQPAQKFRGKYKFNTVLAELHIAPVTCRMQDATHVRYDSVCETGSKLLTATAAQVEFRSLCEGNFCCTCDPFKAELPVQLLPSLRVSPTDRSCFRDEWRRDGFRNGTHEVVNPRCQWPCKLSQVVTLLACVRKVRGSNLDILALGFFFSWVFSVPPGKRRNSTSN